MNDKGHGPDSNDLFGLLFGYIVYREIRDGRLDPDDVFRAGCVVTLIAAAGLGLLLLVAGSMTTSGPGTSYDWPLRTAPAVVAPFRTVTPRPVPVVPTMRPSPTPSPTPTPTPMPGVGERVDWGDGWAITVTKVERWKPSWYRQPGWRLITAKLKVGMPGAELDCLYGWMFRLKTQGERTYEGWGRYEPGRSRTPYLGACSDYHRPTTGSGWVTFEIRDEDRKGLVLSVCPEDSFGSCDDPVRIQLP
jgi:hypothetical protein